MRKPAILLLALSLSLSVSWAQNITSNRQVVIDSAGSGTVAGSTALPFFRSPADAERILASIMDVIGIETNFRIKAANVPNVEATIRHHQRYILYNPDFISQVNTATKNKWASIFILAHEVGHHLEGHTLIHAKSTPEIELQADQFAGYVLCKMGATLEQAQLAMHYIASIQASKTHPGRADRLLAIEKGWNKADLQKRGMVYTSDKNASQMVSEN